MKRIYLILCSLCCFTCIPTFAQDISLFQQFNGRFDYHAIGNTLNLEENGVLSSCDILTSSSADLNLNTNQNVVAAYLYWAGSGAGDFEVSLNGINVNAERTFSDSLDSERVFFAAFADVTNIVIDGGNTTYSLSDFDLTTTILPFCATGTNFGGWAITIIYEDESLALNQLNVYDGLQSVPEFINITLNNLNVLDNEDAKIGFIAWEGDRSLAINEQLTINGNVISNPPLNPSNNAFNGTNSFTGATDLYNMDIDVYNIQDNINIGDTSATISLTSGQDFVMINNIITVLNSQLPDARIAIDDALVRCGDNDIELSYTVLNTNSTDILPANTPIGFYIENELIGQTQTSEAILINGSESGVLTLSIPEDVDPNFNIVAIVDNDEVVTEVNESNNSTMVNIELLIVPEIITLPNLIGCNEGFGGSTFNLLKSLEYLNLNEEDVDFYRTIEDLETETNAILIPSSYNNNINPETIYIRLESQPCYEIFKFDILVENCPPLIPEGFSPNSDGANDWFNIQGLYDIFTNHQLKIYNRYGDIIFEGDNNTPWNARVNRGLNNHGNLVPVGTYYYILNLNDPRYKPLTGYVYVNY